MGKIHESHEGVYTAVQEPAIKRTISGGIGKSLPST